MIEWASIFVHIVFFFLHTYDDFQGVIYPQLTHNYFIFI